MDTGGTPALTTADTPGSDGRRRLSWPKLAALLVGFALVPAFFSVLVVHGDEIDSYPDVESVVRALIADTLVMLAIACLAIWRLGWWRLVLRERRRTRSWVWVVPITLAATSLATVDYPRLHDAGLNVTSTLLLATLLIATAEELMFRGVVLQALRDRHREGLAALLTALLFGAFHLTAGPLAGISSAIGGYLYYASRRVSGGLVVPILAHALWDFSIYSHLASSDAAESTSGPVVLLLVAAALLLVLVAGRRAVDVPVGVATTPEPSPAQASSA